MIPPDHNHKVQINLKTEVNIWKPESRIAEINQIRCWLDELVDWQPDLYTVRLHSMGQRFDVWFKEEHHAVACAMRWS